VETFGGVLGDRQQANIVDDHEVSSQDAGDGLGDGVVCAFAAQQQPEVLEEARPDILAVTAFPKEIWGAVGEDPDDVGAAADLAVEE
jgi:hypothetical protein